MKYGLFILLCILMGCKEDEADPVFTDYQNDVIVYFNEVALGIDGQNAPDITRKWRDPLKVYIGGDDSPDLFQEIDRILAEISALATDGFQAVHVTDSAQANFYIFLGSYTHYARIYPGVLADAFDDPGLISPVYNQRAELISGHMYVDITRVTHTVARHLLREGITQSVGLGRDSPRYSESIFQESASEVTEFADIDRDLIRLLYHPDMVVGVSAPGSEAILREIFKKENND